MNESYIAGFLDGEGCLSIRRTVRKERPGKNLWYMPVVSACQSDTPEKRPVIEELKKRWGGHVGIYHPKGNSKPVVSWRIIGSKAVKAFLHDIGPLLVIKRKQSLVLKKYVALSRTDNSPKPLTELEVTVQGKLYDEMKILNQRGKTAL